MTSALDKLTNILRLEQEEGYRDKAVIGGLARFADAWHEQAQQETQDAEWLDHVTEQMRSYSRLASSEARQAHLKVLCETLKAGPSVSGQGRAPAKTESKRVDAAIPRKPSNQRRRVKSPVKADIAGLDSPITVISGIGPTQSKRLARLGLETVRDMLYFFPRRYDDFSTLETISQLEYGQEVTIMGRIWDVHTRRTRGGKVLTKAIIEDGSGTIEVVWFNQPRLADRLKPLRQIVLSGRVDEYLGRLTFQAPVWEPLDQELLHTARLVPVYPLTSGISARWLRKLIKRTVDYWSYRVPDHLPQEMRQRVGLLQLETALRQIHFPEDAEKLEKARHRLTFDELFLIQVGVLRQRQQWRAEPGQALPIEDETLQCFILSLPFSLTGAQQRALGEIIQDLRQDRPMNRLLQGDVGSGKTVVAAAAMALAVVAGAQAALMVPTEILAEQHYRTVSQLLGSLETAGDKVDGFTLQPTVRLLTGSTPAAEKEAIYQGLAEGEVDVVIGTHALIQEGVKFRQLALAIVDEQHRFGVEQRAALRQKGYNPHMLVMTATPIPRSLALTVYGDLDLSVIDEVPPGRQPVRTQVLLPTERERAYSFVRAQVDKGRQAFVICPLVEESENIETKSAVEEHKRLQDRVFPDLRLGLLHGRLKSDEKEAVMGQFVRGELDILVSTSVVEVGIDVPNASLMLVEGANRFGLAQLHQFRGRVGRGAHPSYCLLIADSTDLVQGERLQAIQNTQDGFALAEKDLALRGPGEFLGTRQSGLPDLRLASFADLRLLEVARAEAQRLLETDPELDSPELRLLVQQVDRLWAREGDVS
jgi:ATP-dependent DNA helicase RecG